MKLERFKEKDNKRIGIIVFTIACILLVCGVILYRTFAIFEVKTDQNIINGNVQGMGDIEFAFYKDNDIVKEVPNKDEGYSLDTSTSKCIDMSTGGQISTVNWDSENWEVRVKNVSTTKTKCYLHFKKVYKDAILNGADPDLINGRLVPVVISETEGPDFYVGGNKGGNVYKADITDSSDPWYKYEDKKWANAVILKDGVEDNYKPEEQIPEEDIESYFVWIPRYSYVLQDSEETFDSYSGVTDLGTQIDVKSVYEAMKGKNGVGNKAKDNGFEIEFGSKDKGISTTLLNKGTSIVHPAFEAFDSNGFWVGKFETGYNQNNDGSVMPPSANSWTKDGAEKNEQASTKVIIKPNVYSWRGIQVANAFYTSYNYQRDLESHMMKNMEWGAVAYLTQSKYGRCTEKDGVTTCEEVRINNNYITGYSAKEDPTCGQNCYKEIDSIILNKDGEKGYSYYNFNSQVSSTTGNYYGIFDISGGAWEYVMGVMQGAENGTKAPASGSNSQYNSGFKGPYAKCKENGGTEECTSNTSNTSGKEWPSSKYYDLYDYASSDQEYQRGLLGDATKEMGPFYSINNVRYIGSYNADYAGFVWPNASWFLRGGSNGWGSDAGMFAIYHQSGEVNADISFRIILTP